MNETVQGIITAAAIILWLFMAACLIVSDKKQSKKYQAKQATKNKELEQSFNTLVTIRSIGETLRILAVEKRLSNNQNPAD